MRTFRDTKRAARGDVHKTLAEPVLFLKSHTDVPMDGGVTCRLHLGFEKLGDLANVRAGYADREEVTPSIIFWNTQVRPTHGAFVITKDMGAYRLQTVMPPDDVTTKVFVTAVEERDMAKYGWDGAALWCGFPPPGNA